MHQGKKKVFPMHQGKKKHGFKKGERQLQLLFNSIEEGLELLVVLVVLLI
jgi:hypothetical protein